MAKESLEERFWSKVDKRGPDECWPWLRSKHRDGYGWFGYKGQIVGAHRVSFVLSNGLEELSPLHTLHTCDNPSCCNPNHLYLGTPAQNTRDMCDRGRRKSTKGINHPRVILTERQIQKIRIIGSVLTQKTLANLFTVSRSHICNILVRRMWNRLPDWKASNQGLDHG